MTKMEVLLLRCKDILLVMIKKDLSVGLGAVSWIDTEFEEVVWTLLLRRDTIKLL